MANKNKTQETEANVTDFIHSFVEKEQKKQDAFELIKLMSDWSGYEAKMWGPSIIGFGSYHYKYASGHEGDAPLIGFSPRKAKISLYLYPQSDKTDHLLQNLGKHKKAKGCIYINKLADIDIGVLKEICLDTIQYINKLYPNED